MSTITASGVSTAAQTERAVNEATKAAMIRLGGAQPSFGFLFVSPRHVLGDALRCATKAAHGASMVGCTTAGEITEEGLVHDGLAVLLVASDNITSSMALARGIKADPRNASNELLRGVNELRKTAALQDRKHLTTVLLTDGQ